MHCTSCHDTSVHTRTKRVVNSYAELRDRIALCELGAELKWFEEEVEDVTLYLNDSYYGFPID